MLCRKGADIRKDFPEYPREYVRRWLRWNYSACATNRCLSIFSSRFLGSPPPANLPNRVPPGSQRPAWNGHLEIWLIFAGSLSTSFTSLAAYWNLRWWTFEPAALYVLDF
jgi:hypothetical protein